VLLQALNASCALWENAKDTCDEAERIYQTLASMLSSFETPESTESTSSSPLPETPFTFPGMGSPFQPINMNSLDDRDLFSMSNDMEIDWVSISFSYMGYLSCINVTHRPHGMLLLIMPLYLRINAEQYNYPTTCNIVFYGTLISWYSCPKPCKTQLPSRIVQACTEKDCYARRDPKTSFIMQFYETDGHFEEL
jgi:hypothetical protein